MSRHESLTFDPTQNRGADLENIFNALHSSHLGDGRPAYAQAGLIWAARVFADPADTTSDVVAADLFLDSGTAGIPIGRFDFVTGKLSLDATAREMFGAAAYLGVGTDVGDVVTVQDGGKLPALDASDLTNVPAPSNIPLSSSKRVARLMSNVNGGAYRMAGVALADNSLRGWGNNSYAQLGQGAWSATTREAPVVIPRIWENMVPIKWVSSAYCHWVLFDTGVIYVWGRNNYGELGVGNTAQVSLPQRVTGALDGLNIVDISVGYSGGWNNACHVLVLTDDGRMFACGYNGYGQVGNGNTTSQSSFVEIGTGTTWAKIYAVGSSYGYSMAIDTTGRLHTWGYNGYGQLGLGDTANRNTPALNNFFGGVAVDHVSGVQDNHYGGGANPGSHVLARLTNGKVYSWGFNGYGQLGLGDTTNRDVPQEIAALGTDNEQVLAAGGYEGSSYVRKTGNTVYSAGYNGRSALGREGTTNQNTFGEVTGANYDTIEQVIIVGGASYQSLFIRYANGRVRGCGYNGNGQLGIGSATNAATLQSVPLNAFQFKALDICAVGVSSEAALGILTEAGQYLQTGYGGNGQNGDEDESSVGVPRLITF
jgi:alpha-tubulin suppressor-like RCC1 family protein